MKTFLGSLVFTICFVAVPFVSFAQTADDYGTGTVSNCPNLTTTLSRGMRDANTNGQVTELQSFIADQFNLPDTFPSGFFGGQTQRYVVQFQQQFGLPAYGIVGSMTRAKIAEVCVTGSGPLVGNDVDAHGCKGSAGYSWCESSNKCIRSWEEKCAPIAANELTAYPRFGAAPLTVTFETRVSGFHPSSQKYILEYGDGTSEPVANCFAPTDACSAPGKNMHTYRVAGTFVARLVKKEERVCGNTASCAAVPTILQSTSIVVSGASVVNPEKDPQCKVWFDGCNTCSRSTPGGPGMCTMMACLANVQICADVASCSPKPYCKEYFDKKTTYCPDMPIPQCVGGTITRVEDGARGCYYEKCGGFSVGNPSINGFSGPTTLRVGEQGTWSVQARDPNNGQLSYSIVWGDEPIYYLNAASAVEKSVVQQTTFTHAYAVPGTYTVTITVIGVGGKATTTSTVQVANGDATACTMEYAPVCATPYYCTSTTYAQGAYSAECQNGKTYGNKCAMNAEKASYLYSGECKTVSVKKCTTYVQVKGGDAGMGGYRLTEFAEGASTQCLIKGIPADNTKVNMECIADASYVCRNGNWNIEGGLPMGGGIIRATPSTQSASISGGITWVLDGVHIFTK